MSDAPTLEQFIVSTKIRLAEELDCDRKTLTRYEKMEGCPGATKEGHYNVHEWRAWVASNDKLRKARKPKTKEAEELRGMRLQNERREIENARLRGESIGLDEAIRVMTEMTGAFAKSLDASKHTLAPQVAGESVPEATKRLDRGHKTVLKELALGEWAKKKLFWSRVYASQSLLLKQILSGNGESAT